MPSLSRIFLFGTLTRMPTFHQTARNTPLCTFDRRVPAPERHEPCVIRVVIFGKQAEPSARHLGSDVGAWCSCQAVFGSARV
jgi:single-stranded DNA-binding protein